MRRTRYEVPSERTWTNDGDLVYRCGTPGEWTGIGTGMTHRCASDVFCPHCYRGLRVPIEYDGDDPRPGEDVRAECLLCGEAFFLDYELVPSWRASKERQG